MSLKKSATRRLPLLAGSSLAAVTISALALTGAATAPTFARAANECAPIGVAPSDNGPVQDTYACTGATTYQTTGVTYSSQGALIVNTTGAMDVGAVGINLTGNTTDAVTFTSNNTITGVSGAVIDITSGSGNITATVAGVTANTPGATYGFRAESTGGGNITVTKTNTAAVNNNVAGGQAAIAAITNGGNVTMTLTTPGGLSGNQVSGRLRGILAQTSGAGAVNLTLNGAAGFASSSIDGVATVDVIAGTGGANINVASGRVLGGAGAAIRAASTSTVNVNNTNGLIVGSVDFSGVTAGGVNFLNSGAGASSNTAGRWLASGSSVFSGVDDVVGLAGPRSHVLASGTSMAFGGGVDTINLSGVLVSEGTTITGLEALNNSGAIYLGAVIGAAGFETGIVSATDAQANDLLSLVGTTFTGSSASHIVMDVVLGGVAQVGCETIVTADCLDLRDGSTAGSTLLTINDVSSDALLTGYNPQGITVIDVSGSGSTAPEHFTLDPASTDGYVHPVYGAAFDRPGNFVYLFRYDEENQHYVLVSQPRDRSLFDYAILTGAAQSIWHLTAETVTSRQTDLRDGAEGGSVWLRTAGEVTRRDTSTAFEGWDDTYTFDNSYKLYAGAIIGGLDLISGSRGEFDYVLGAQIGYVASSFDMDEAQSSGKFTGGTGGAYASLWSDWFFLDGAVNINGLTLDYQNPDLVSKTTTYLSSVGASAETGVRAKLTENAFAEPLMAMSWVRTSFEEISLIGAEVETKDAESLRGGLGLRLGATSPGESVSASYFVTGRGWYEAEGESAVMVHNSGADLDFGDEFSGAFGEAELGVNVFNAANTLSGFATTGVKWKKGYSAVDLSLGVRLAW